MKKLLLPVFLAGGLHAHGSLLLFSDNFNTGDGQLNSASTAGRLDGIASTDTALESFGTHQDITGNQLDLAATGGVRFGPQTSRYDWAGATTGPAILAAGGFTVSFDWAFSTSSTEWIGWKVGTINDDHGVNAAGVDHALLLRRDGRNERWDNGVNIGDTGISFNPASGVATIYPVTLTYTFDSFADGESVSLTAVVNGIEVVNDTFLWDGNGGALRMELHSGVDGNFIDNFTISTIPEPGVAMLGLAGLGFFGRRSRRA